ncbi:MAG: hypothetical protein JEY91_19685 [Spirochaetaceae bacterium]|nr:hypothetical protein [Spirochaetaceae bacterium]
MKNNVKIFFSIFISLQFFSCEAFFTNNWFQGAVDASNVSVDEAISSGDTALMQEVYNQIVLDAANATGSEAAELYLQAADLALGISGLSDPAILLEAPVLLEGGDGGINDIFSILTDSGLNLDALEDAGDMIYNANSSDPESVTDDMWVFAAAGNGATIANQAEDAGQSVEDYLGDDPMDNSDALAAVQALVNAIDSLPEDTASELWENQADLEGDGIIFP